MIAIEMLNLPLLCLAIVTLLRVGKADRKAPKSKDWVVKKKERRRKQQGSMCVLYNAVTDVACAAWRVQPCLIDCCAM
jgi:hypothetical protein